MNQLLVGLVLLAAEVIILIFVAKVQKQNSQIRNEIKLVRIKHESFVEAFGFFEKNGLLKKYNELAEQKMKEESWIKTTM